MRSLRFGPPALAVALVVYACAVAAAAPDQPAPGPSLRQLFHQSWGVREGAPGAIIDITQTEDGYLWLAGTDGVFRFDGVRFERPALEGLRSLRRISRLIRGRGNSLWIAHAAGISTLRNGVLEHYTFGGDLPRGTITDLALDRDGRVWAASRAGLLHLDADGWRRVDVASGVSGVTAVLADRDGHVWVGGARGLFVRRTGAAGFEPIGTLDDIRGLSQAPDGSLFASTWAGRLLRVADARMHVLNEPWLEDAGRAMAIDRFGALWAGTNEHGVVRRRAEGQASAERSGRGEGLTADDVFAVFEDRESNVWVGTSGGLDMFRTSALVPAELPSRLHAGRLAVAPDGIVWVASQNRPLIRWHRGGWSETNVPAPVSAVYVDADGRAWAWARQRLWRQRGRAFVPEPGPRSAGDQIWALAADATGRIWVASERDGVWVRDHASWSRPAGLPPACRNVRVIQRDAAASLWLGCDDGVVAVVGPGGSDAVLPGPGGGVGPVGAIAVNGPRTWLAGPGGVALVEDGRSRLLPALGGAEIGRVKGVVAGADGSLWMNADRGVVSVAAADVVGLIEQPDVAPRMRAFDYLDGSIGGAAPLPAQAATADTDGRLWFVGFDTIVRLDPTRLPSNLLPPPVLVRGLSAGGVDYAASPTAVSLPMGTTQVQIAYTALSLTIPGRVAFRYALDGVDAGWQDAGTRRDAFYTNLAPGTYRFRVIAANNDGLWNESGATQTFVIPPAFHQTASFKAGAFAAVTALVLLACAWRVRQVRRQMHAQLQERLDERERIARELHDTLLQGLQGIILRFQAVASSMPAGASADMMERTLRRADQVLVESRDRVRGLRASTSARDTLPGALADAGTELAEAGGPAVAVRVDGRARPLHPIVADEAYWIGREAISNAVRHASARHIEAVVDFTGAGLRVVVQDDGIGIRGRAKRRPPAARACGACASGRCVSAGSSACEAMRKRHAHRAQGPRGNRLRRAGRVGPRPAMARSLGHVIMDAGAEPIRVLTVDDHPLLREGIAAVIANQPDIVVVGEAGTGEEAVAEHRRLRPDVTLMDLQMPGMGGIDAIGCIRLDEPHARVIVLTTYDGDALARRAIEAGARAYLLKSMLRTDLLETIRAVHAGRTHPPEVASGTAGHHADDALTGREVEVLRLVAEARPIAGLPIGWRSRKRR
ncbi:MAG: response regulator [Vicinamibacterales bacterium]